MQRKILVLFGIFVFTLTFTGILAVTNINSNSTKELDENNIKPKTSAKSMNPTIDGIINSAEWANLTHNITFYLDLDNTIDWNGQRNVDGDNYLYIGKNDTHIHIAVDFCGDQTFNRTGEPSGVPPKSYDEWFGVWLNTLPRYFDDYSEWHDLINNSVESLCYNVKYNQTESFFTDELTFVSPPSRYINDETEIDQKYYSAISGDYIDLRTEDATFYIVDSVLNNTDQVYRVDFSVDLTKWFDQFPDLYINAIKSFQFRVRSKVNVTLTNHTLVLWYSDGTVDFTDPDQVRRLEEQPIGYIQNTFNYGLGNLTDDNIMKFSLYGNSSVPFNASINSLYFQQISINETNWVVPSVSQHHKYSSIQNYHLNYSFGASANNATPHRMYELAIPKNELEHYDDSNTLGIIIGGYGTAAFLMPDSNYWCYEKSYGPGLQTIGFDKSSEYIYCRWTPLPPAGLPTPDDDDDDDDEIDMTLPIILTVVFVSVGAGVAVVVVLVKKGILDFSKLKRR